MIVVGILVGVALVAAGVRVALPAMHDRRARWRAARPFAGGERAAPEPALVPPRVVMTVYLGWTIAVAGVIVLLVTLI